MRNTFAAALLAASTLSTIPSYAAGFDPMGPVLAEAPDAATLNARCDEYVAEVERRMAALEAETGPATLDGTLARYDELTVAVLGTGLGEFTLYQQVMADQARRDAGSECQVRLSTLGRSVVVRRKASTSMRTTDAM